MFPADLSPVRKGLTNARDEQSKREIDKIARDI
jgi:hypothetical protein